MKKIGFIIVFALFLIACGDDGSNSIKHQQGIDPRKPMSWGKNYTIYVFADDAVWKEVSQTLHDYVGKTISTTENEKYFNIVRADFEKMSIFYKYKNLIFLGDTSSTEQIASYIKTKLGKSSLAQVEKDGVGIFKNENLWANDQLVTFIVGSSLPLLEKIVALQKREIFDIFKQRLLKRLENKLTAQGIRKTKSMNALPVQIEVPRTYLEYKSSSKENFASFYRRNKKKRYDRFVTVYYDTFAKNPISREWIIKKRNELGNIVYEGDYIRKNSELIQKEKLGKYDGISLQGAWQNDDVLAGGAFKTFAYWIPEKNIVAIVDGYVYNPHGDKLPGLLEIEIIANTLSIK